MYTETTQDTELHKLAGMLTTDTEKADCDFQKTLQNLVEKPGGIPANLRSIADLIEKLDRELYESVKFRNCEKETVKADLRDELERLENVAETVEHNIQMVAMLGGLIKGAELNAIRTLYAYHTERRPLVTEHKLLNKTSTYLLEVTDPYMTLPGKEKHYELLSQINWGGNSRTCEARLVAYVQNRVENNPGIETADLALQTVLTLPGNCETKFAIIPSNLSVYSNAYVEEIPYTMLTVETETLHMAGLLYERNNWPFQKCVEIAERL